MSSTESYSGVENYVTLCQYRCRPKMRALISQARDALLYVRHALRQIKPSRVRVVSMFQE